MKPICPDCGDRHEPHQAHVWNVEKNKPVLATKVIQKMDNNWITPLDNAKKPSYRHRDPEKRRAQMAEVMRRRRLRLKAA